MQVSEFTACLRALDEQGVEFILVGGLAAVLQGAPVQTYDVDIVYARTDETVARLLRLLGSINAIFRTQPERQLKPNASHLRGGGHLNLITQFGPLDLLATIGDGLGYEDLLPQTYPVAITEALTVKVLRLDFIISLKEKSRNEKDLAVLPVLRQTARELKKQEK